MNGIVDSGGRALLDIELHTTSEAAAETVSVWIDTGFTGDLVLPHPLIERLGLPQSGTVAAILADGSEVSLRTFTCWIKWFDQVLRLQVVGNEGESPLLGIGLLLDHDLRVNYRTGVVSLE